MRETKGSFDFVIELIEIEMRDKNYGWGESDRQLLHSAIKVLEAAGKVDKAKAMAVYGRMDVPDSSRFAKKELREVAVKTALQIRALLEALPDGGKK
jgi:hypothetical protein